MIALSCDPATLGALAIDCDDFRAALKCQRTAPVRVS